MASISACKNFPGAVGARASFRAQRFVRAHCVPAACRITAVNLQREPDTIDDCGDLVSGSSTHASTTFAALAPLLFASAAHAEDATEAAAAATSGGGFGAGEAALLLTPVIVYALFNVYRDRINPQAKFLDYIYIMAFLAIVANLFSIVVFKTRFF